MKRYIDVDQLLEIIESDDSLEFREVDAIEDAINEMIAVGDLKVLQGY